MDFASSAAHYAAYIVLGITSVCLIFFALRYVLRYLHHLFRMTFLLKGMTWYEVVLDATVSDDAESTATAIRDSMKSIMLSADGMLKRLYRPVASVVIKQSKADESVRLYLGFSNRHIKQLNLSAWSRSLHCVMEKVDVEDIGIPTSSPSMAILSSFSPSLLTDTLQRSGVGGVMRSMGQSLDDDSGQHGALIISFEPMSAAERDKISRHITSDIHADQGMEAARNPKMQGGIQAFQGLSPSRAVVVAFSAKNNDGASQKIINGWESGAPSRGVETDTDTPLKFHVKNTLKLALLPYCVVVAASVFGWFPWWATITTGIVLCAGCTPLTTNTFFSIPAARGVIPIPVFWRLSPRRLLVEKIKTGKTDDMSRYTGRPSCKEVIPTYQTAMAETAAFPNDAALSSHYRVMTVPQVAADELFQEKTAQAVSSGDAVYIGLSAKSRKPIWRNPSDFEYGLAVSGQPGSGKTNVLQIIFAGVARLSRKNTGLSKDMEFHPIWIENKPDDIDSLIRLVKKWKPLVVRVNDDSLNSRLTLEGKRIGDEGVTTRDVISSANGLVEALQQLYGEGIGPRARQVISAALYMSMLMDEDDIRATGIGDKVLNVERYNIMEVANYLTGADGSLDIANGVKNILRKYVKNTTPQALRKIESQYGESEMERQRQMAMAADILHKALTARNDNTESSRNKLEVFAAAKGLFEPSLRRDHSKVRAEYSLDDILKYKGPIILDMTGHDSELNNDSIRKISMMIHFMMWKRMQVTHKGNGAKGIFTPIFVDEATLLVGRVDDNAPMQTIVSEIRDLGRSYGVAHYLGFQNYAQLPRDAREAIKGFASAIHMQDTSPEDWDIIVDKLGTSQYSRDNFANLPMGIGVAKLSIGKTPMPPFSLKTPLNTTWIEALANNSNNLRDALDSIYDDECEDMRIRSTRKRKDAVHHDTGYSRRRQESAGNSHDVFDDVVDYDDYGDARGH